MIIKEYQLSVNWLLNQVLGAGKTQYQITKVDDDQLNTFLLFLFENPFPMPNGENVLRWIRNKLSLHHDQALNKASQEWETTRQRYRFIIQKIDHLSAQLIKEDMKSPKPEIICSNELSISF